jgi:5-methylcytosine-specific restriction protein A
MAKLSTIKSSLPTLPSALPGIPVVQGNYGKGRGGRPWRRLRESILQRDQHLCLPCKAKGRYTQADEVDHVVPEAEGGTDDRSNLQSICKPCHDEKTKAEQARGAARARGART